MSFSYLSRHLIIYPNYMKHILSLLIFISPLVVTAQDFYSTFKYQSRYHKLIFESLQLEHISKAYDPNNAMRPSGYIEQYQNNYIFINTSGEVYLIPNKWEKITQDKIKKVATNLEKLIKDQNYEKSSGQYKFQQMGIKDLYVLNDELYLSVHKKVKKKCYSLEIFKGSLKNLKNLQLKQFTKIDECLHPDKMEANACGGRIDKYNNKQLLFTLGDCYVREFSQDDKSNFGKTLLINLNTGKHSIFSKGHRNHQGLYVNKAGLVFSSEHGPHGGDEINLLIKGRNYGWPLSTYGWPYDIKKRNKKTPPFDQNNKFEKPLYTTFGEPYSQLIQYEGEHFLAWKNALIVSTLMSKKIIIYYYDPINNRIFSQEEIDLGKRIRDLIPVYNNNSFMFFSERPKPELIRLQIN